jgi:hypothetical protein
MLGKKKNSFHDTGGAGIRTCNLQTVSPMPSQLGKQHPKEFIADMILFPIFTIYIYIYT